MARWRPPCAGRCLLPFREVPVCSGSHPDAGRSRRRGALPGRRAAAPEPRPGFRQGGVPRRRAALPGPRPGHVCRGRPRPGRGRVRSRDPAGLGGPGRGHPRRGERDARRRRAPDRAVGSQSWRVLRPAAGQRRPPGQGVRRAVRPLRLRAGLGPASRADPGGVPGALEVGECGRGGAPRHGAQPGRPGRAHHRAAADRGGRDSLTPWQQSRRLADEAAGPVEFLLLEQGGHGCANVSYRHRPYAADWMARQLGR
jgi:hypothetical protein